jgi:nucleoside-diphosphate-sugar epimerase
MKALVTGAGGFTGGHLVRYLAAQGDDVRAMVRDASRAPAFDEQDSPGRVEIVTGDLTDVRTLERAMQGVDVVYNIAARYREANLTAATYRAVNATAVEAIVTMAPGAGVRRVVQCSTVGVHGDIANPPANEEAPLRPGDVYQETKLEGERLGREAAARSGVDLVIARPTGIYGPGDRRLFKLIGGVARGRFLMLGPGRNFYHLTYVDDLSAGFRLCGTVPAAAGRTYILAGGEVTTLADLIAIIAEVAGVAGPRVRLPVTPFWLAGAVCEALCAPFGIEPPIYRRRVDFFRKSRAFDASRARAELGYAPVVGLCEGIGRTLRWYRDQGWI